MVVNIENVPCSESYVRVLHLGFVYRLSSGRGAGKRGKGKEKERGWEKLERQRVVKREGQQIRKRRSKEKGGEETQGFGRAT